MAAQIYNEKAEYFHEKPCTGFVLFTMHEDEPDGARSSIDGSFSAHDFLNFASVLLENATEAICENSDRDKNACMFALITALAKHHGLICIPDLPEMEWVLDDEDA